MLKLGKCLKRDTEAVRVAHNSTPKAKIKQGRNTVFLTEHQLRKLVYLVGNNSGK